VAVGPLQVKNLNNIKLRKKLRRQRQRKNKAAAGEKAHVATKVTTPRGVHEASASKCEGGSRVAAGDGEAARVAGISQTDATKSQNIASIEASKVASQVTAITITGAPDPDAVARWQQSVALADREWDSF